MRQAEESLLDTEAAQLELQGLAGRLAAQQHHHNSIERGLEMQGTQAAVVIVASALCRAVQH